MSRDKQIDEMRYLADEMGKAISTELEKRYLADEQKLEEVLKANGWCKASDLAEEIFADIHNTLLKVIGVVDEGLDRSIRNDNEEAKLIHAGTLEILKCLILIFAKLKKKYIGKDTNVTTKESENNDGD